MSFLIVIAGLAGLVWGAILLLRGGLLAGGLMVLLAGTCFGSPFFSLPAGPVPITADRLLWVLLAGVYAVSRARGWIEKRPMTKSDWLLAAFLGVVFISTFTHAWHVRGRQPVAWLLFFYIMPAGMYWIARQTPLDERSSRAMFACLAIFGLYLAVTAIAEARQLWWLVYPRYIASREYLNFFGRGRGPLLNPAGCGFFLSICWSSLLMFWPRWGRAGKALLLALSLVYGLGVYSTLTRCAWIGAALGLMIVAGLSVPRTWRMPLLVASCLTATIVGATQWERFMAFKRDEGLSAQEAAESVNLRPILAMVAWKMFLDRPLLGCGYGHYRDEFPAYLDDRTTELPLEKARPYLQHNVFLSQLAEIGLVGMGLFIALLSAWLLDAWRLWRSPSAPLWARQQALLFLALMGSYFANAMFHDLSIIPMVNMALFYLAGLTSGLSRQTKGAASNTMVRSSGRPRAEDAIAPGVPVLSH
ncbi:MAG TPA: O-antigen ligase family protein [Pirellulales bacterium]|nr:O-antigen ligase family protein [Pirellulales bacterium]